MLFEDTDFVMALSKGCTGRCAYNGTITLTVSGCGCDGIDGTFTLLHGSLNQWSESPNTHPIACPTSSNMGYIINYDPGSGCYQLKLRRRVWRIQHHGRHCYILFAAAHYMDASHKLLPRLRPHASRNCDGITHETLCV